MNARQRNIKRQIETANLTWHVAPEDQGQIVEVAYAIWEEELVRRVSDGSDRSVSYALVSLDDVESDKIEPWHEAPVVPDDAWETVS